MSCQSVMISPPVAVRTDDTVATAIDRMFEQHVRTLPVVDAQGKYQGLFGIQFLLKELLPRAVTMPQERGLSDLAFMHDTLEDVRDTLKARLAGLYPKSVSHTIHRDIPPLYTEDSLLVAMLRVYQAGISLPVIDKKNRTLMGIVSHWSILEKLTGHTS